MAREHGRDECERGREDRLPAERACDAVERVLVRVRVRVVCRVVGGLQGCQRCKRGGMAHTCETYVCIEPRLGVVLPGSRPFPRDIYGRRCSPIPRPPEQRGLRLAEGGHEFECRIAHFVLFVSPFTFIAVRALRDWRERERATAAIVGFGRVTDGVGSASTAGMRSTGRNVRGAECGDERGAV